MNALLLLSICRHVGGLLPLLLLLLLPYSTYATLVDSNDTTNNSMMVNMVGGYKSVSIQDEGVMDAANFVFETLKTSNSNKYNSLLVNTDEYLSSNNSNNYEIIQASQQIVAGINYKLSIMIIIDGNNNNEGGGGSSCIGAFDVTVYDQFGTRSVTNWGDELLTCDEAMDIRSKKKKEEKEYASSEEEDAI